MSSSNIYEYLVPGIVVIIIAILIVTILLSTCK